MKTLLSDPYGVCSRRYTEGFTLIFPNSKPGADRNPRPRPALRTRLDVAFRTDGGADIAPERKRYHD
jgi:hypothetical protein